MENFEKIKKEISKTIEKKTNNIEFVVKFEKMFEEFFGPQYSIKELATPDWLDRQGCNCFIKAVAFIKEISTKEAEKSFDFDKLFLNGDEIASERFLKREQIKFNWDYIHGVVCTVLSEHGFKEVDLKTDKFSLEEFKENRKVVCCKWGQEGAFTHYATHAKLSWAEKENSKIYIKM